MSVVLVMKKRINAHVVVLFFESRFLNTFFFFSSRELQKKLGKFSREIKKREGKLGNF